MDEFDEKRNMVQMLLQMLKGSAADEVGNAMQKAPEGMPEDAKGLEIDKVSVLPHDKPEMEMHDGEHDEAPHEEPSMADSIMKKGEPEMEAKPDMEDDEDDMPMSPFASLLKKKK